MKKTILFTSLLTLLIITTAVLAAPQYTFTFNQPSFRPGTSGTITVSVTNTDAITNRITSICITPTGISTSYVTGFCYSTTTYLNVGQSTSIQLSFSVSNDAPTPSSLPISINLNYDSSTLGLWLPYSYSNAFSIPISGISIKDEANQDIIQVTTKLSSAQNSISSTQGAITTAQNMITTAQKQYKDVSTANGYLSSAQSTLSSAQSYLNNAQNELTQSQSNYNSNNYQASLSIITQASTDSQNANSISNNAYQSALQAQTAVTNAGCISGYALKSGQCLQIICSSNSYQCSGSIQQQCSSDGTQWIVVQNCNLGCNNGQCVLQTKTQPTTPPISGQAIAPTNSLPSNITNPPTNLSGICSMPILGGILSFFHLGSC